MTRGAFSSEATREECISILTGQRQAVDVIAEHWGQQHTQAGQDLKAHDVGSDDGPAEGDHREDATDEGVEPLTTDPSGPMMAKLG
ncbi:hypothetical protein, partial [Tritonibacter sp. SIMBA_163]|uniref:hypothetical protein n=1 Tax=Tritonibacter sp. SIMBA_163 TaxID=3080868 RepID=UPI00397EE133